MRLLEARVLIIDDDPATVSAIARVLEDRYELQVAMAPREGLMIAASDTPSDLILLDINMPEMDGFTVCQQLKDNPRTRDIPVLFVSGSQSAEEQIRAFEAGAVDFISKPILGKVLAAKVKTHLDLVKKTRALQQMAITDPLTNIANQRQFNHDLESTWKKYMQFRHRLGLLLIDIDDFSNYNQTKGYGVGDNCLVMLGQIFQNCRSSSRDLVARLGGEEFAMLIKDADENRLREISDKIFSSLKQARLAHPSSSVADYVTVSIGASSLIPEKDTPPELLYEQADQALRKAQKAGKNQLIFHDL